MTMEQRHNQSTGRTPTPVAALTQTLAWLADCHSDGDLPSHMREMAWLARSYLVSLWRDAPPAPGALGQPRGLGRLPDGEAIPEPSPLAPPRVWRERDAAWAAAQRWRRFACYRWAWDAGLIVAGAVILTTIALAVLGAAGRL